MHLLGHVVGGGFHAAPPADAAVGGGFHAAPPSGFHAAPPSGFHAAPPADAAVGGGFHAAPPSGFHAAPPSGFRAAPPFNAPYVILTPIGAIVKDSIAFIEKQYDHISIANHTIMPNHVHVLLVFESGGHGNPTGGHGNPPLQDIIGRFKSFTNMKYIEFTGMQNGALWQRNFYDHIIRDEDDFLKIYRYIDENPAKWLDDCYY